MAEELDQLGYTSGTWDEQAWISMSCRRSRIESDRKLANGTVNFIKRERYASDQGLRDHLSALNAARYQRQRTHIIVRVTERARGLIATGVCVRCGQVPAADGIQMCRPCADRNNNRVKAYQRAKRAAAGAKPGGSCRRCGKPGHNIRSCRVPESTAPMQERGQ